MQKLSEVCGSFLQGTTGPGTWGPSPKESKHTAAYTSLIECRFRQPNFHLTVTAQVSSAVDLAAREARRKAKSRRMGWGSAGTTSPLP